MWENLVDLRDARTSSENLVNSNYEMVIGAAMHPDWLHKIVTYATEYQNLANCINSQFRAGISA